jgi:hypothetical protein
MPSLRGTSTLTVSRTTTCRLPGAASCSRAVAPRWREMVSTATMPSCIGARRRARRRGRPASASTCRLTVVPTAWGVGARGGAAGGGRAAGARERALAPPWPARAGAKSARRVPPLKSPPRKLPPPRRAARSQAARRRGGAPPACPGWSGTRCPGGEVGGRQEAGQRQARRAAERASGRRGPAGCRVARHSDMGGRRQAGPGAKKACASTRARGRTWMNWNCDRSAPAPMGPFTASFTLTAGGLRKPHSSMRWSRIGVMRRSPAGGGGGEVPGGKAAVVGTRGASEACGCGGRAAPFDAAHAAHLGPPCVQPAIAPPPPARLTRHTDARDGGGERRERRRAAHDDAQRVAVERLGGWGWGRCAAARARSQRTRAESRGPAGVPSLLAPQARPPRGMPGSPTVQPTHHLAVHRGQRARGRVGVRLEVGQLRAVVAK